MSHCVSEPPDSIQTPRRSALEIICESVVQRTGVRPHYARLTSVELMNDLHDAGWWFYTDDGLALHVWAWLVEHGLDLSLDDVRDPALRVTIDLEAC